MDGATFNLNFISNAGAVFNTINTDLEIVQKNVIKSSKAFEDCQKNVTKSTKAFEDCQKALSSVSRGISKLGQMLDGVIAPGIALNTQMADLSAITGLAGAGLKEIEKAARDSAKTFGTDASQSANSYKLILSQLSPEIAKNSEAMKLMGNNVGILSKTMGGDTVAATEVLTTAMNQYGVNLDDPIQASKTMAEMMNVMAAGAKEGSAKLPQIKQALEQVGMVAKTTGVSFVTTNAAIQMLDKAGKKGSEGGVALRNVLTTLSEGRFAGKDAAEGLAQMHISTDTLADASIPLTTRLRMLQPVMQDTALMAKIFGKENMAASIALIQSADEQDALAKKITGTNTAVEQANTVMGSYQERMNRATAIMNDWKISIFNATQAYVPYLKHFMTGLATLNESASSYMTIKSVLKAFTAKIFDKSDATKTDTNATTKNTLITGAGSIINRIYAATIGSVTRASIAATVAQYGLNLAMLANPVGLIIVGVMALVGTFIYLWNHSKRFREILFGIWEAAKAVFHNIGVFIERVWNMVIKPVFNAYWSLFKFVWGNIWDFVKWIFNGIASVFVWLYEQAVSVFTTVKDFVVGIFEWIVGAIVSGASAIGDFFSAVWDWFSGVFSGFAKFIDEWLIQPVMDAFGGVWDWIVGIFEKIMDKLTGIFAPIKKFFKTLFSSEGMTDVGEAYTDGKVKGGTSYDNDQAKKSNSQKTAGVEKSKSPNVKKASNVKKSPLKVAIPATKSFTGVGATDKKEMGSGSGSGPRNLTIGKLIENMNLYFYGTVKESKESIKQSITDAVLTAVNDVNLAN